MAENSDPSFGKAKPTGFGLKSLVYDSNFEEIPEAAKHFVSYNKKLSKGAATVLANGLALNVLPFCFEDGQFNVDSFLQKSIDFFAEVEIEAQILKPEDRLVYLKVQTVGGPKVEDFPESFDVESLSQLVTRVDDQPDVRANHEVFIHEIGTLEIPRKRKGV